MLRRGINLAALLAAGMWGLGTAGAAAAAGTPEGQPKPESADSVVDRAGDRMAGRITSLGADGLLRITSPCVEKEVAFRVSALRQATFTPAANEADPHLVFLTNGDRVAGTVAGITPAQVVVQSSVAGKLAVDLPFVRRIQFRPVKAGPPSADFENGETAPFEPVPDRPDTLAVEYAQDKAITIEADFVAQGSTWCTLSIFAADARKPRQNAVFVSLEEGAFSILCSDGVSSSTCTGSGSPLGNERARTLRLSFDPAGGQLEIQLNGRRLWNGPIMSCPRTGRYIVIGHAGALPFRRFRVVGGNAKGEAEPEEDPQHEIILFASGDRVTAENVTLADGRLSMKTEAGELATPIERLAAVTFRTSALKTPAANPAALRVSTPRSILTLDSVELNDQALTGRAIFGGPVRIGRAALKSVAFPAPAAQ